MPRHQHQEAAIGYQFRRPGGCHHRRPQPKSVPTLERPMRAVRSTRSRSEFSCPLRAVNIHENFRDIQDSFEHLLIVFTEVLELDNEIIISLHYNVCTIVHGCFWARLRPQLVRFSRQTRVFSILKPEFFRESVLT